MVLSLLLFIILSYLNNIFNAEFRNDRYCSPRTHLSYMYYILYLLSKMRYCQPQCWTNEALSPQHLCTVLARYLYVSCVVYHRDKRLHYFQCSIKLWNYLDSD